MQKHGSTFLGYFYARLTFNGLFLGLWLLVNASGGSSGSFTANSQTDPQRIDDSHVHEASALRGRGGYTPVIRLLLTYFGKMITILR